MRCLRALVGGLFVLGAALKVASLGSTGFERTLAWKFSGGSSAAIVALAIAEGMLGALFATGSWIRTSGIVMACMVVGFSGIMIYDWMGTGTAAPCGCMGGLAAQTPDLAAPALALLLFSLSHNVALLAAIVVASRAPTSTP